MSSPRSTATSSVDEVWAEEGEWVYITVKPDAGYRLDELTVTRPSGNEVKVYHVRDNVFRFKMPGVRVTVDAEFVRSSLPFSDVSRGQWFYDYVAWAYNTGLMEGVSAGRFAPNSTTTRAMVVTIIYRLAGSPGVSGTSDFTDVPAGAWYSDAVTWAAKRGIVEGMTATTFDPNDAVTREELAAMLYRYAKHKGYDTSAAENTNILSYNDALSISEYAFEALQWPAARASSTAPAPAASSPAAAPPAPSWPRCCTASAQSTCTDTQTRAPTRPNNEKSLARARDFFISFLEGGRILCARSAGTCRRRGGGRGL